MSASVAPKNSSGSSTSSRVSRSVSATPRQAVEVARDRLRGEDLGTGGGEAQRAERARLELLGRLHRHDHHRDEGDEQDDDDEHGERALLEDLVGLLIGGRDRADLRLRRGRRAGRARQRVGDERDDGLRRRRGVLRRRARARSASRRGVARDDRERRRRRRRRACARPSRAARASHARASTLLPVAVRSSRASAPPPRLDDRDLRLGQLVVVADRRVVEDRHPDRQREQDEDPPVAPGVAQVLEQDREDAAQAHVACSSSSSTRLRPARWMKTSASVGSSECTDAHAPRADELLQARGVARRRAARRRSSVPSSSTTSTSGACLPRLSFSARGRVERDDLAVGEERHARAQLVGLVHVVRREEDRRAAVGEPLDGLAQVARGLRVQAARRLVHEQHARAVEQRAREQQALAHAGRERLDLALGDIAQAHLLEHLGGAARGRP